MTGVRKADVTTTFDEDARFHFLERYNPSLPNYLLANLKGPKIEHFAARPKANGRIASMFE
jgi:hypothetical protein